MNWSRTFVLSFAWWFSACTAFGAKGGLAPATSVDLNKYMGPWRIIATTDNKAERNFVDAVETYTRRSDGKISASFQWRSKSFDVPVQDHQFTARVRDPGTNAQWKARLFPLFAASYIILEVDPAYKVALVGHPSRKFGWILARERTIPDATYAHAMEVFKKQGYDTGIFKKVPQVRASNGAVGGR